MVGLMDYFVDAAERDEACWNLDGTLWGEVYRRHRGKAGSARLHDMIRRGRIGYAGNYAVLLWGILDTETAIRACYGAIPIEKSTGVRARTALVMENPGMRWDRVGADAIMALIALEQSNTWKSYWSMRKRAA